MNTTRLASRCRFVAQQLRIEADHHAAERQADLARASIQLALAARHAFTNPDASSALLTAGVDRLVDAIMSRTFTTRPKETRS